MLDDRVVLEALGLSKPSKTSSMNPSEENQHDDEHEIGLHVPSVGSGPNDLQWCLIVSVAVSVDPNRTNTYTSLDYQSTACN